jgi:hypothetical protein
MKTMVPPANSPGLMSGSVTRRKVRQPDAPRLRAACWYAGSTFANAADALR